MSVSLYKNKIKENNEIPINCPAGRESIRKGCVAPGLKMLKSLSWTNHLIETERAVARCAVPSLADVASRWADGVAALYIITLHCLRMLVGVCVVGVALVTGWTCA